MNLTDAGIVILLSFKHPEKASFGIFSTIRGIEISINEEQFSKIDSPIDETLSGSLILVNDKHPLKQPFPICKSLLFIKQSGIYLIVYNSQRNFHQFIQLMLEL